MLWRCKWCSTNIELTNGKWSKSGHLHSCQAFQRYVTETLTPENLKRWYVEEGKSMPDIASIVGLGSVTTIHRELKRLGIQRTMIASHRMPASKEKSRTTNLKKHGAPHNFSKEHPARKAFEERLLFEEGITNVFQRLDVKQKCYDTLMKKYGVERIAHKPRLGRKSYTKQHRRVMELLDAMGAEPLKELRLPFKEQSYRSYDVYVKSCRLIIEINGNYYHADPSRYQADELIKFGKHTFRRAADIWARDAAKQEHARKLGYCVEVLWDDALKAMTDVELTEKLRQLISE